MTPLKQRSCECSLASICTLNSLSQADYKAVSDLAREHGAKYDPHGPRLIKAIAIGIEIAKRLGLYVPADYTSSTSRVNATGPSSPDFSGKGIARLLFKRKRCRNWSAHVIAFEDGVFYESDGTPPYTWDEMVASYKKAGSRQLRLTKIFR